MKIPNFITHYHLADRQPFLTLSELANNEDDQIFENLRDRHKTDSTYKRRYGRNYIDKRQKIENKLRQFFIARGGQPSRQHPFYFVLGQSNWFKHLIEGQLEVRIELCNLSPATTSFTFPDSYVALSSKRRPYHDKVFLFDELESVINKYGMPTDEAAPVYEGYWKGDFEKYIEFQIWEDAIVQPFIEAYQFNHR